MSDEGSSADLHVTAPSATEAEDVPSVGEQLIALRTAALDDLGARHASYLKAQADLARAKERQTQAAAVALDTGVDIEVVAGVVGVSVGTVRNWAKSLEGGA